MNAEATSWIAFGVALVTMVGGVVKSMIDSRDKQFNTEQAVKVALLMKSHEECVEHHRESQRDLIETKKALEDCRKGHEENDRRLSALEAVITPEHTPKPKELG